MNPIVSWEFGEEERYQVRLAVTEADVAACADLRFRSYVLAEHPMDVKMLERYNPDGSERYPNGLEQDEYDQYSQQLLAVRITDQGEEPVGTFRLIDCSSPKGFYIEGSRFGDEVVRLPEEYLGITVSRTDTQEASRLIGHQRTLLDGRRVQIKMLLMESGRLQSIENRVQRWICILGHREAAGLRRLGWTFSAKGPAFYMNADRELCIVDLHRDRMTFPRVT